MKWVLKDYLNRHEVTPYQLAKATGLSVNTVYPLARGEAQRISLDTLQTVLDALDKLTGKRVELGDVLERDADEYEFPGEVPGDIRERIERFERGEVKLIPAADIAAKYGVKR